MTLQDDFKFACPRPRTAKACEKCRARKIRCLPDEKAPASETCRRCAKFGHACTFTAYSQPRGQKSHPTRHSSTRDGEQPRDDVVSKLFEGAPKSRDEPGQIYDFHRRMFQSQFAGVTSPSSDDSSSKGIEPAPALSQNAASDSGPAEVNLDLHEAEKMLSRFRHQKLYFPFVEIPDSEPASAMAARRPFLLLAILVVSSLRNPLLQRRTDEKLRRVLSDRVVFQGEKSLDYVQGLLVYIAWYPFHLRPMQNQSIQFLKIATSMISDLKLAQDRDDRAARLACLGCYNLSSILCNALQRPGDNAADEYPKALVGEDGENGIEIQYSKLQLLLDEVVRYNPNTTSPDTPPENSRSIEESTIRFNVQLQDLDTTMPPEMQDITPLHLTRLFLKVNISFTPLKPLKPTHNHNHNLSTEPPPTPSLETEKATLARRCFADIEEYLETFLSTPEEEYTNFSTREWSQLILTSMTGSRICFFKPQTPSREWRDLQRKARARMRIYLESLSHRLDRISVSSVRRYPDVFCMFKSVLDILVPTYVPLEPESSDTGSEAGIGSDMTPESHVETSSSTGSASRCPVLNGSIQQTNFWEALNDPFGNGSSEDNNGMQKGDISLGFDVDGLFNESQDWPSIFSEWVVDFNSFESGEI